MVFCCILTFIQPDNSGSIILPEKLNEFKEYFEVFARTIFEKPQMFYLLHKLKPKTKTKFVDISTFLYTLNREDKNFFSPTKTMLS